MSDPATALHPDDIAEARRVAGGLQIIAKPTGDLVGRLVDEIERLQKTDEKLLLIALGYTTSKLMTVCNFKDNDWKEIVFLTEKVQKAYKITEQEIKNALSRVS